MASIVDALCPDCRSRNGSLLFYSSQSQFASIKTAIEAPGRNDQAVTLISTYAKDLHAPAEQRLRLLMMEREQRANLDRASASLLLSLWTRNMGFVTGMILALVGAMFILSRLADAGSELTAAQGALTGSLKTSSPGIVLAVLGAVLMIMAMSVRYSESGKVTGELAAGSGRGSSNSDYPITQTLNDDGDVSEDTRNDLSEPVSEGAPAPTRPDAP